MTKLDYASIEGLMDWTEWLDKCLVDFTMMTMDRETITYRFDVPDDDLAEQLEEEEACKND